METGISWSVLLYVFLSVPGVIPFETKVYKGTAAAYSIIEVAVTVGSKLMSLRSCAKGMVSIWI